MKPPFPNDIMNTIFFAVPEGRENAEPWTVIREKLPQFTNIWPALAWMLDEKEINRVGAIRAQWKYWRV